MLDEDDEVRWVTVWVTRRGQGAGIGIRNGYSQIPLNIMVDRARKKKIVFESAFDRDEKIPAELKDIIYKDIEKYVTAHSDPGKFTSKHSDWNILDDPAPDKLGVQKKWPWLTNLRHDYFHFSAHGLGKVSDPVSSQ